MWLLLVSLCVISLLLVWFHIEPSEHLLFTVCSVYQPDRCFTAFRCLSPCAFVIKFNLIQTPLYCCYLCVQEERAGPRPRLCHMKRGPSGYGFNLHSEKSKPGQFIRAVDEDSPAQRAGLRPQDKIIQVQFTHTHTHTHTFHIVPDWREFASHCVCLFVCCVCVCCVCISIRCNPINISRQSGNWTPRRYKVVLDGCVCSCRLHIYFFLFLHHLYNCVCLCRVTRVYFCVHLKQEVSDVHVEHGSVGVKLLIVSVGWITACPNRLQGLSHAGGGDGAGMK